MGFFFFSNMLNNLPSPVYITSFNPYNNLANCITYPNFKDKEGHRGERPCPRAPSEENLTPP